MYKSIQQVLKMVLNIKNSYLELMSRVLLPMTVTYPMLLVALWLKAEIYLIVLEIKKIVSEYDQEIPQSQTADNPTAPRGRATQPPRDTRKTH